MGLRIHLHHIDDGALERALRATVRDALGERAEQEDWFVSVFRSQDGTRWDIAIKGPRGRAFVDCQGLPADLPDRLRDQIREAVDFASRRRRDTESRAS